MMKDTTNPQEKRRITFAVMSSPAKALATCVIVTLAFGMAGALGQIVVHDIIPTFFVSRAHESSTAASSANATGPNNQTEPKQSTGRGDLFADLDSAANQSEHQPIYRNEQFVWTLKWTHIHLFGMNTIFIFMGVIALFLDIGSRARAWLIVLPFIGVLIDVLAMWLKGFASPVFFWLHVPGGGLFAAVFGYVSLRAFWEMWGRPAKQPDKA